MPVRKSNPRAAAPHASRPAVPATVDAYLARVPDSQRATLERLRRTIRAAAPGAEECIRHGIPTFELNGRMLVSFAAATRHLALYPGAHPLQVLARELADYDLAKGTIRYTPARPLPDALVRKIVRARVAERG